MQHTPSEVFHYTDSRGQSDAIQLSKSTSILLAAKRDLLGIIQLQVRGWNKRFTTTGRMCFLQCDTAHRKNTGNTLDGVCAFGGADASQYMSKKFVSLLQDTSLLDGRVTLHHVKAGAVVARQGDQVTPTFPTHIFDALQRQRQHQEFLFSYTEWTLEFPPYLFSLWSNSSFTSKSKKSVWSLSAIQLMSFCLSALPAAGG